MKRKAIATPVVRMVRQSHATESYWDAVCIKNGHDPRHPVMTYAIAHAAATDAADERMSNEGRTKWNKADLNHAARIFNYLFPETAVQA